jgi:UDP:flavonoid glycosyltransferase YjiC (YdhE family)
MRVLICSGGGSGNVHPLVPFARALSELGSDVTWAVSSAQQAKVTDLGFECVAVGPRAGLQELASHERDAGMRELDEAGRARSITDGFAALAHATVAELTTVVEDFQPDVLLRDSTAMAAWIVGERTGVPVALFDFGGVPPSVTAKVAGPRLNQLRDGFGLPADPSLASLYHWLVLVGAPPGWTPVDRLAPTAHVLQPPDFDCAELLERPAWLDALPAGRPVVYCTLGTVFGDSPAVWKAIFEAAAREPDITFVAAVTPPARPSQYADVAGNVRVGAYIPNSYALDVASAVICHGGYGSIMGALRRGVPIVSLPMPAADNILNATRMSALGAGIMVPQAEQTAQAIRGAVGRVLTEPSFKRSVGQIASQIAQQPSAAEGAQLIRRLARTRQPILRGN